MLKELITDMKDSFKIIIKTLPVGKASHLKPLGINRPSGQDYRKDNEKCWIGWLWGVHQESPVVVVPLNLSYTSGIGVRPFALEGAMEAGFSVQTQRPLELCPSSVYDIHQKVNTNTFQ